MGLSSYPIPRIGPSRSLSRKCMYELVFREEKKKEKEKENAWKNRGGEKVER